MKCGKCEFQADDLSEHALESGHMLCVVCQRRSLTEFEPQVCEKCVGHVRDDLTAAASTYGELHLSGFRVQADILALLGDGATQGGGPDDHFSYHDPCSAAAELERIERDWREEFGHGKPNYPPLGSGKWQSRRPAHVFAEAYRYLTDQHLLAAKTHPGFDDYAQEIAGLRFRLQLAAGEINFPRRDPVPCPCGGKLVQEYGPKGLVEERTCRDCGTTYTWSEYHFNLRLRTETPGWVSVTKAAELVNRPIVTIKAWAQSLDLPSACNRLTRRTIVDEKAVRALHEERATRKRAS